MGPLDSYAEATFTHAGKTRKVFRKGTGPAVIVIEEMPGISPGVIRFADMVVDAGFTATIPHLFGEPGIDATGMSKAKAGLTMLKTIAPLCVSKEFNVFAAGKTSPAVDWLRALAREEHERCGGPGVGAIGMCFTGGFALAMATDPVMLAPVLSQPSLPFTALGKKQRASIDCSPADMAVVQGRCAKEGLEVIGLRFKSDKLVGDERFPFLKEKLGDAFIAVELEDADAKPNVGFPPHSVVTEHLIDEPGTPTRAAVDLVLDMFRKKLLVDA